MARVSIVRQFTGGLVTLRQTNTLTGPSMKKLYFSVPVGKSGVLSVRNSATSATFTMSAGHGIETGDVVDIYNSIGGAVLRHGVVGTVSGNSVPITTGTGTIPNLVGTSFVLSRQISKNLVIADPTDLMILGIGVRVSGTYRGTASQPMPAVHFVNAAGSTKLLVSAGYLNNDSSVVANIEEGDDNALSGISDVDHVLVSNPITQQLMSFQFGCLIGAGS